MKDEIKEINIKRPGQILDYVDTKDHLLELFNYITNLQEKYNNSQITLAEEWKKRLEAEEKNKHLDNQITMLKQQNNAITEMGLDYKSRNEKAIEKLESIRVFGLKSGKTLFSTLINETIDILNINDK